MATVILQQKSRARAATWGRLLPRVLKGVDDVLRDEPFGRERARQPRWRALPPVQVALNSGEEHL
eukprot:6195181-Pleurochrysis_carterae.AAC.2